MKKHKCPNTLPVMDREGRYYVFIPLKGNGEFGAHSFATILREKQGLCIKIIRQLTYEEECRLADAHEHHMIYWAHMDGAHIKGVRGALCMCIPYSNGVRGRCAPYPERKEGRRMGGSRV